MRACQEQNLANRLVTPGYTDVDVKVASHFDTKTAAVMLSSNDLHTPQMFGFPLKRVACILPR